MDKETERLLRERLDKQNFEEKFELIGMPIVIGLLFLIYVIVKYL